MHIEILVEDLSGKKALDILVPKIVGDKDTFRVHAYKGIGRIPSNMKDARDPSKRILLANLPKLLKGYGRTFHGYQPDYRAAVIVVCDLDDRNRTAFLGELNAILNACHPRPETYFCLAIEEGEAWFLGDLRAVRAAYPVADDNVLNSYVNDSICGTWEVLADAVYPGGAKALSRKGWQAVGAEKTRWAEEITPLMDVENNASPSFNLFREKARSL
jgi:hypothetical protein